MGYITDPRAAACVKHLDEAEVGFSFVISGHERTGKVGSLLQVSATTTTTTTTTTMNTTTTTTTTIIVALILYYY